MGGSAVGMPTVCSNVVGVGESDRGDVDRDYVLS